MDMFAIAAANREAVKGLLHELEVAASDVGYDDVAERLGVTVPDLLTRLCGDEDLTLTELRLIAIATGVTVGFSVNVPARELVNS